GLVLVRAGFTFEVWALLSSWGVLVPALQGTAVLLGKEYLNALHPLLGLTLIAALFNVIRLSSPLGPSHRLTLASATAVTAIVASSYFVIFQFSYIHNSLVSALFLLIAAHALWSCARDGRPGWLALALPALIGFALARIEAPVFAAMLLVLAFAVG